MSQMNKLWAFSYWNSPKSTILGIFNQLWSTQNGTVARFTIEGDFWGNFPTLWMRLLLKTLEKSSEQKVIADRLPILVVLWSEVASATTTTLRGNESLTQVCLQRLYLRIRLNDSLSQSFWPKRFFFKFAPLLSDATLENLISVCFSSICSSIIWSRCEMRDF